MRRHKKLYIKRNRRRKMYRRFFFLLLLIGTGLITTYAMQKDFIFASSSKVSKEMTTMEVSKDVDDEVINISTESLSENGHALLDLSYDYPSIKHILRNIHDYPENILELVVHNPETIDYVKDYKSEYPKKDDGENIKITKDDLTRTIPLFLQWDKRWGYYNYGKDPIAVSGCGPTALSMVAVGLTKDVTKNPKSIADFAYKEGYFVEGKGSSWTLMSQGAHSLGIKAKELPLSKNSILSSLRRKEPVIVSVKPGDFTTTGHYIVLTGVTSNGKIIVNDPNSLQRSQKKWDLDLIMSQTKNLWAFSKN